MSPQRLSVSEAMLRGTHGVEMSYHVSSPLLFLYYLILSYREFRSRNMAPNLHRLTSPLNPSFHRVSAINTRVAIRSNEGK